MSAGFSGREAAALENECRRGLVWSERNLDGKPFFVTNTRTDRRTRISVRESMKLENGLETISNWTVIGHAVHGLPGAYDQDVYVAVLGLLEEQGGPDDEGKLWFKPYQLLHAMGQKTGGKNYEDLAESIERISGTHVVSEQAFYSASLKRRITKGFSIWSYDRAEHFGARGSNMELSYLEFDRNILDSYKHGYLDRLDAAFYRDLSGPLVKRVFRLLNERCDGEGSWTIDAMTLRGLVPLSEGYRWPSRVLHKLDKAHDELVRRGFLDGVGFERVSDGSGDRVLATYKLAPNFGRRRLVDLTLQRPGGKEAVGLLASHRMSSEDAAALVSEHGVDLCVRACEALVQQKNVRNPVGWLKRAIKDGWAFSEPSPREGRRPKGRTAPPPPPGGGPSGAERDASSGAKPLDAAYDSHPVADPEAEELWAEVLARAAEEIEAVSWRVWFEGTVPIEVGGSVLTISVPNDFAEEYIGERFKGTLESSLRGLRGEGWSISIVVAGEAGFASGERETP